MGSVDDPRTIRVERYPSRLKICPGWVLDSIAFVGDPRQIHEYPRHTWVRGHFPFGHIVSASFPSASIRTIRVAPGLDSHDAPFVPTRRRELQRRCPYPREDRGGDARGNLSVPIRAPERRRRTMWARSQAHRSEPCCGSVLFARAPAFAACERPYRPYP